ncbi:hypothetical protein TSUD_136180 [Trifolium subterraneum]|uniref:Uncharacterized protein n=1 Tax=Trifolium subterraneum TaxID=3900 RepID=A0A2Z6P330_TRISU|nr:hypothetical protein TSUD_136180 [Trifolium subterraneum]
MKESFPLFGGQLTVVGRRGHELLFFPSSPVIRASFKWFPFTWFQEWRKFCFKWVFGVCLLY